MRKAIDNYARGKQREVEAWKGQTIHADSGRFICPECLENVALTKNGHFRHKNKTSQSIECDKRVDSTTRTAYERMGLPLYLCKQTDGVFYLGIGFAGQDQETLIEAENKCSYLTIGDGAGRESRYSLSTDRFAQNSTTIIPVNYKPANGYYRVKLSDSAPPKLKLIWPNRTDIWGTGQFYKTSETNSKKIRPLGTIVTDEEYYFTGDPWRLRQYNSFINITKVGELIFLSSKTPVYKLIITKSKATDTAFSFLSDMLRNIYKVNLLVGESSLNPVWPPCIWNAEHIFFDKEVTEGHFSIKSPNENPVVYKYNGGNYITETIKDIPATYSIRVSRIDTPVCIDRAFNGNIQFIGRRDIEYNEQQRIVNLLDEDGRSIINSPLKQLKNKEFKCITNFPAKLQILKKNKKNYFKSITGDTGCVLTGLNWNDQIIVFDHYDKIILELVVRKQHAESDSLDEELYNNLIKCQKGPLEKINPKILALYKSLGNNLNSKKLVKSYVDKGYIPKAITNLLIERVRRK